MAQIDYKIYPETPTSAPRESQQSPWLQHQVWIQKGLTEKEAPKDLGPTASFTNNTWCAIIHQRPSHHTQKRQPSPGTSGITRERLTPHHQTGQRKRRRTLGIARERLRPQHQTGQRRRLQSTRPRKDNNNMSDIWRYLRNLRILIERIISLNRKSIGKRILKIWKIMRKET